MARMYRRVIRITAEDSPNVRLARAQEAAGYAPSGEILYPGVLPWNDYVKRVATWDDVRQCIGLRAQFYTGASVLMYPPQWLDMAERAAALLEENAIPSAPAHANRRAKAAGIDSAEGGDDTTWTVGDEWGVLHQVSEKTPDTNVIVRKTIEICHDQFRIPAEKWVFDRGGGGKQHADRLRAMGYKVTTIGFGESVFIEPRAGRNPVFVRKGVIEERYAYFNRRAQMYGELREMIDPFSALPPIEGGYGRAFGIPGRLLELRRQLSLIPLIRDAEGRMKMLPKNKRAAGSDEQTLTQLIGCSPDEADSTVLMVHGLRHSTFRPSAGAPRR